VARIAYLGPEGTFSEAALLTMAAGAMVPGGGQSDPQPTESTRDALEAVRSGAADFACVPIENSIEGSVLPTLDSLASGSPLQIYAELTLEVAFSIVTRPGVARAKAALSVSACMALSIIKDYRQCLLRLLLSDPKRAQCMHSQLPAETSQFPTVATGLDPLQLPAERATRRAARALA
jgi:prephenate dehydratase